ncbi:5'-3' exoribonuclease 2 [Elasticomyces elasticus]|nr:5'-3' exoribonuclease 2 [Elasticomyces elasticus]
MTTAVLMTNVILAIWLSAHFGVASGIGTAYEGDCGIVNRWTFWLHVVINILSSILLSASNYTMQCLSAPTRREVDVAHAKGDWLDIGVSGIRNLTRIGLYRRILWAALALSSLPIHLLFNSAVFKTLQGNQYGMVLANPAFLDGGGFDNSSIPLFRIDLVRLIQEDYTAEPSGWQMLDPAECITAYAFVSRFNNVMAITTSDAATGSAVFFASSALYTSTDSDGLPYKWICADTSDDRYVCDIAAAEANAADWTIDGREVDYCLAQTAEPHCQLQFSVYILLAVIMCNMIKSCSMLCALYWQRDGTLVTLGDALASFLDEPQASTRDRCLMSKRDVDRGPLQWVAADGSLDTRSSKETGMVLAIGRSEHSVTILLRLPIPPPHRLNTDIPRHVLNGLDADLIMLGLATHEPHFRILREDLSTNDVKPGHCRKCNLPGHMADQCRTVPLPKPAEKQTAGKMTLKPYVWLHVGILREHLAVEMNVARLGLDLERVLDDWMFMCLFVGNDFLPHLPSLEIRENGIDTLIRIWTDNIELMGGYVTFDGQIDLLRAQVVLESLAKQEATIFKSRRQTELQRDAAAQRRAQAKERREFGMSSGFAQSAMAQSAPAGVRHGNDVAMDMNAMILQSTGQTLAANGPQYAQYPPNRGSGPSRNHLMGQSGANNMLQVEQFVEKHVMVKPEGTFSEDSRIMWNNSAGVLGKRTRDSVDPTTSNASYPPSVRDCDDRMPSMSTRSVPSSTDGISHDLELEDTVKLWETGYEGRYYAQKFHVSSGDVLFRSRVARAYVEGLSWILLYYTQGCPSWTWYYPYHYAPFATDFVNIGGAVSFDRGTPFRPYELLMGVMPARSNNTIPKVFHSLMTQLDSPIIDFYPENFETDLNGKKYAWQGVVLLPWIDEKRLLDAMETKYPLLTADEIRRNTLGHEDLMFSICHPLYEQMMKTFLQRKGEKLQMTLDPRVTDGLHGIISRSEPYKPDSRLEYPLTITHEKFASAEFDDSVTVRFAMPELKAVHRSMLLPGVVCDAPVLQNADLHGIRGGDSRVGRSQGGNGFIPSSARPYGEQRNSTARNGSGRAYGNNNNYRGSTVRGGSDRASGDNNRGSTCNDARSRGGNGSVYRRSPSSRVVTSE